MAESSWLLVYPQGLRGLLKWVDKRYNHTPVYVFENGVSVPGETSLPIEEAVHDTFRLNYYNDYISNMASAINEDGVDVRGYFAWSLMDNFEWADGYNVRFGMVYVDYNDN
jgi:beta-glucosidase